MHPVGSYCTDISQCTVNNTLNFIFMCKGRVNGPCSEPVELKCYPHLLFSCTNFVLNTVLSYKVFKHDKHKILNTRTSNFDLVS